MGPPDRSALRVLESRRLTLVASSRDLIAADLSGPAALAEELHADVPSEWPPPLFTNAVMALAHDRLARPAERGWSVWYLLARRERRSVLVGLCQFKGRPDKDGRVEIAYALLEPFQGRGYATEAVCALAAWAFGQPGVRFVTAETMPYLRRSIRVLENAGFRFDGPGSEQGVVRYVLSRSPGR